MKALSERLKQRAKALGLPDAEVARRAGLSERRYGNYVSGIRQPDYDTLIRICTVLAITPNEALGWSSCASVSDERDRLMNNLKSITSTLADRDLRVAVSVIEALAREFQAAQSTYP